MKLHNLYRRYQRKIKNNKGSLTNRKHEKKKTELVSDPHEQRLIMIKNKK